MNRTQINSLLQHELLCCRVCLMMDCRLYNIHDYKLADTFTRISGTPVSRDRLPQYLCAYCHTLLLKCSSFRDMCLRTLELLTPALLKGALDTDYVRKYQNPHRSLNLTQTELEFIEINPSEDFFNGQILNTHIKNEQIMPVDVINEVPEVPLDVQKDLIENSDCVTDKLDSKDGIISKMKTETSIVKNILLTGKDINGKKNIRTPKKTKNEKNLNSKLQTKTKVKENILKTGQVSESVDIHKNIKTEKDNEMMTTDVKDNKIEINVTEKFNGDDLKERKRGKKRSHSESNLAKFANTIDHKLVTLSKEEQLEEIATRKKSQSYLELPFKCEDCGKGFGVESAFNNHRVRHSPSIGPVSCNICAMRLLSSKRLREHQSRHRMKYICNQCNFISRDKSQANKHHATHAGKTYTCPHCEKSFIKNTTYFNHVRVVHAAQNVDCVDCGETFVGEHGLMKHKKLTHDVKSHQFVCTMCSAMFNSAEALNRHTDTAAEHGDLRPCEQCGENCASEDALREHVGAVHPTELHHCERCSMAFSNAAALDTHTRRKHLGQRYRGPTRKDPRRRARPQLQAVCEQCGATVRSSSLLEYHKRAHLAVKPYACPHCPKTFALAAPLKRHIRSHTGEKPYQCPECPLAFTLQGNYTRHYKVAHLGKRDAFPCPVCGRASTTRSAMKVHLRAVHGDAGWPKRDRCKRRTKAKLDNK